MTDMCVVHSESYQNPLSNISFLLPGEGREGKGGGGGGGGWGVRNRAGKWEYPDVKSLAKGIFNVNVF